MLPAALNVKLMRFVAEFMLLYCDTDVVINKPITGRARICIALCHNAILLHIDINYCDSSSVYTAVCMCVCVCVCVCV